MERINEIAAKICKPDPLVLGRAQARLDNLTKPLGSLGRLEELAKQVCGISGKDTPDLRNKVIFTLAGDHGVTEEGVSPYPKEVTAQMVYNFLSGGAAINVLAKHAGARVVVADLGVAKEITAKAENFKSRKVGLGTKNFSKGPAMSRQEAIKSIETGIEIFEEELAKGIDIIGTGEMGIGNTTSSSAITCVFTSKIPEEVTGRGTGIDNKSLENKIKVIRKSLEINRPDPSDPVGVLEKVGGYEIGGLSGVILAAAAHKIPVVIDGFISGAAALIACNLEPKTKEYLIASHCSQEKGHKFILENLGLRPLLDLDLRLGEGTGAALAMDIIEAAVKILNQMATFKSANVSEKNS